MDTKIVKWVCDNVKTAISIMDEKGRGNPEGNSKMLWDQEWDQVRELLVISVNLINNLEE